MKTILIQSKKTSNIGISNRTARPTQIQYCKVKKDSEVNAINSIITNKNSYNGGVQVLEKPKTQNIQVMKDGKMIEGSPFLLHCYPSGVGPNAELIQMLERDIVDRNPGVTFDDIASLEGAKQILKETVLLPLLMPEYFKGVRSPRKGVLLFGPPGTGKTMLAKAVATFGKTTFFNVHASTIASKWKGDSEKLVRILFEMARFYSPTTIFIDEIDAIASTRDGADGDSARKVKAEILVQIDGCNDPETGLIPDSETKKAANSKSNNIIVLGATNLPWDLDNAIIRRLDKRIYVPLPDKTARKQLFEIMLKKESVNKEMDWDKIVNQTHMYSGDDIKNLCRDAGMAPLRRMMLEGKIKDLKEVIDKKDTLRNTPISQEDFAYALENVKPSNSTEYLERYAQWMNEKGSS